MISWVFMLIFFKLPNPWPSGPAHLVCVPVLKAQLSCSIIQLRLCTAVMCVCVCVHLLCQRSCCYRLKRAQRFFVLCLLTMASRVTVVETQILWTDFLNSLVEWRTEREQDHPSSRVTPTLCVNRVHVYLQCVCVCLCVSLPGRADCQGLCRCLEFCFIWLGICLPFHTPPQPSPALPCPAPTTCLYPPSTLIQHNSEWACKRDFQAEDVIITHRL